MKLSGAHFKDYFLKLIPYLLFICIGIILFSSAGRDDAYITYWPAHTLSQTGQILNYNGDFVEQSSSLLHVLILAFWEKCTGFGPLLTGRIFSMLFGLLTLLALSAFSRKIDASVSWLSVLLTATSVFFIYWSFGGMETTLVACCTLLMLIGMGEYLHAPDMKLSGLILPAIYILLYILARPENMFIAAAGLGALTVLFLVLYLIRKENNFLDIVKRTIHLAGITIGLSAAVVIFRKIYFKSIFPQPVLAKLSPGRHLLSGRTLESYIHYFEKTISTDWSITVLSVITTICVIVVMFKIIKKSRVDGFTALLPAFLLANVAFIFFSTGDWMEGGRFFVHILPLALICIPVTLHYLKVSGKLFVVILCLFMILQGRSIYAFAKEKSLSLPLWEERSLPEPYGCTARSWWETRNLVHLRDLPLSYHLQRTVARCWKLKQDTVILFTGQMGMAALHVAQTFPGQIRFMDHFALTERSFTECPKTRGLSRGRTGLRLKYEYFLNLVQHPEFGCMFKKPDIIYDVEKPGRIESVLRNGYTLVFRQTGSAACLPSWHSEPAGAFIAVKNELFTSFPDQKLYTFDFHLVH